MLIDVVLKNDPLMDMVAGFAGYSTNIVRLGLGIYQIGHFNFEHVLGDIVKEKWPDFSDDTFNSFGVCDDFTQIIAKCPELVDDRNRKFAIAVCEIIKSKQPAQGGWRWHKWGPYIGTKKPTTEYLYDETEISSVFVYSIVELK